MARLDVLHRHARLRIPIGRHGYAGVAVNAAAHPGSLSAYQPRLERGIGRNDGQHAVASGDSHRCILLSPRFDSKGRPLRSSSGLSTSTSDASVADGPRVVPYAGESRYAPISLEVL